MFLVGYNIIVTDILKRSKFNEYSSYGYTLMFYRIRTSTVLIL